MVLQQCRKIPHSHTGWDEQHKEYEDPGEGTGRGQQGSLAAAKAAHTQGHLSRTAAKALAETIIPIWRAARHTSNLVFSGTEESSQLERVNGMETAAHHARPETVRKAKAGALPPWGAWTT